MWTRPKQKCGAAGPDSDDDVRFANPQSRVKKDPDYLSLATIEVKYRNLRKAQLHGPHACVWLYTGSEAFILSTGTPIPAQ